jgi:hypothetical protein
VRQPRKPRSAKIDMPSATISAESDPRQTVKAPSLVGGDLRRKIDCTSSSQPLCVALSVLDEYIAGIEGGPSSTQATQDRREGLENGARRQAQAGKAGSRTPRATSRSAATEEACKAPSKPKDTHPLGSGIGSVALRPRLVPQAGPKWTSLISARVRAGCAGTAAAGAPDTYQAAWGPNRQRPFRRRRAARASALMASS